MSTPREFWIIKWMTTGRLELRESKPQWEELEAGDERIHVIESSALESVKQELKCANEKAFLWATKGKELGMELESVKRELEEAREYMADYCVRKIDANKAIEEAQEDFRQMANEEIDKYKAKNADLEAKLKLAMQIIDDTFFNKGYYIEDLIERAKKLRSEK